MSGFRWPRTFARSVLDSEMFNKNLRRWLSKLFERGGEQSFERLLFLTILRGKFTMIHGSMELYVCKCLKTFLSLDTFYSFFFFNLSFTFYLVAGNILSLLSNVNPQNSSASVFTRVYTHERGYREQRILVVRHKITVYRNRSFGKKPACFGQCFQFSPPRAKLSGQWTCAGTVPCPGHQQLGSF